MIDRGIELFHSSRLRSIGKSEQMHACSHKVNKRESDPSYPRDCELIPLYSYGILAYTASTESTLAVSSAFDHIASVDHRETSRSSNARSPPVKPGDRNDGDELCMLWHFHEHLYDPLDPESGDLTFTLRRHD
jgi:hypothetical protein